MEITWVKGSMSWFWIKSGGKHVHIDPSYTPKRQAPGNDEGDKADLILVTHAHGDHFQEETLEALRGEGTVVIAPAKVARRIGSSGQVRVAEIGKEQDLGWIRVKPVLAYNLGLKGHIFHKKGQCVGYLLAIEGRTLYHAGDTGLIPEMKELHDIDLAMLPMGGTFTMDVGEAAEAARIMHAKIVVPMHNLKTPVNEMEARLQNEQGIQVIVAEKGRPFGPF